MSQDKANDVLRRATITTHKQRLSLCLGSGLGSGSGSGSSSLTPMRTTMFYSSENNIGQNGVSAGIHSRSIFERL